MSILGDRLKELREAKGWSKKLTAEKLHLKQSSTYSNWEYGLRDPDTEMLSKLADLFDVPADYILGRDEYKHEDKDRNDLILREMVEQYKVDLTKEDKKNKLEQLIKIVFEDGN